MATIFCPSCGFKSTYQFAAPNFCSKCGQPYLSRSSINLRPKKNLNQDEQGEYDDEIDEDGEESFSNSLTVPRISKLQVDLDFSPNEIKSFKFGEIFGETFEQPKFPFKKTRNLSDLL